MGGLLIIGVLIELLIKLYELLTHIWPFLVAGLAVVLLWLWVVVPLLEYRAREAREARERLRHERARQQIGAIEHAATRAMLGIAEAGEITGRTSTEVEPRRTRPR
jgi:uncharacterized membrane protein